MNTPANGRLNPSPEMDFKTGTTFEDRIRAKESLIDRARSANWLFKFTDFPRKILKTSSQELIPLFAVFPNGDLPLRG